MKRLKKYGLILTSVLLGLYACQRGIDVSSNDNTRFKEYRTWVRQTNGIFSNEELVLQNQSGEKVSGKLSWSLASEFKNKAGEDILVVPFTFSKSVYKNKKVYNDVPAKEHPSIYSIVIKKDKAGDFEARFRARSFIEDVKGNQIVNTIYKLSGQPILSFVREEDGKNYPLFDQPSNASSRTNSCDVTTSINRYVECSGGMNNTVCVFYSQVTVRYRCTYEGTIPEEVQNFEPADGGGWYEYEQSETSYQNQHIIDSLQGYPCAQDIVTKLPDCNGEVDSLLINVFGINEDVNLKFKAYPLLTKDSADGYTTFPGGTALFYNQTIQLNPWVMQHSTKEYIAATIIHESMHAIIDYWKNQYLTHQIDSNQFKSMFPIYWDQYRIRTASELAQHNEMANNYIETFKRFMRVFSPNISEDMANALAWGGLHKTTSWAARNDTNQIKNLIHIGRLDGADTTSFQMYNLNKCD